MRAIFLDIEATGLDPKRHVPIDIALKIVDLRTGNSLGEYQTLIHLSQETWDLADPASMKINGYTFEQVYLGKEISQVASDITTLFSHLEICRGKAVFICQNPTFDRAFFAQIIPIYFQEEKNWPYHWLDLASMYWIVSIMELEKMGNEIPEKFNLSKNAIAQHYHLPPEQYPHRAMNGVIHLIACYRAVANTKW